MKTIYGRLYCTFSSADVLRAGLITAIMLPVAYLFVAIQYSAITYPYWDHLSAVKWLAAYYDGTLTFSDLFEAQTQSRPFIPRAIFLLNGIATDWDIRSEYVFIYITIYGLIAVHLVFLRRLLKSCHSLLFLCTAAVLSVLICSPVAHHTHYYSLMLLPTLSNLLAASALFLFAAKMESWPANIWAAILSWMSAYSVSNGLFLFPVIFIVSQLATAHPLRINKFSLFWLVNMVVLWDIYLPGLPMTNDPTTFLKIVFFSLIYLGNSLGSILWFPVEGQFIPESASAAPAFLGLLLLAGAFILTPSAIRALKEKRPEGAIFLLFVGFAVLSALVTARGRSGTEYLIPLADSSRYAVYSIYLPFAFIYYAAAHLVRTESSSLRLAASRQTYVYLFCGFLTLSAVSYYRAMPVYKKAAELNNTLSVIYAGRGQKNTLDEIAFPSVIFFRNAKLTMYRLGIGPYRAHSTEAISLTKGKFSDGTLLTPGVIVSQRVALSRPVVNSIDLHLFSYGKTPSFYFIDWRMKAQMGNDRQEIGRGRISTTQYKEWEKIVLQTSSVPIGATEIELELHVEPDQIVGTPAALPLFQPADGETLLPLAINSVRSNFVLGVDVKYERY